MMSESEIYHRALEIDTCARTIWGEARGEGSIGMQAVAAVIQNRLKIAKAKGKFWWGNSVIEICQKPYQFSCWNRDDPNYRKILNVDQRDPAFVKALNTARIRLDDPTHGATHYHAVGIYPFWARNQQPTATIGRHIFYRILS